MDLLDVDRIRIDIGGHVMMGMKLYCSPVMEDQPIFVIDLIMSPEGALANYLCSQEQYDFTVNPPEAPAEGEPQEQSE
jgi:hypothetical protein